MVDQTTTLPNPAARKTTHEASPCPRAKLRSSANGAEVGALRQGMALCTCLLLRDNKRGDARGRFNTAQARFTSARQEVFEQPSYTPQWDSQCGMRRWKGGLRAGLEAPWAFVGTSTSSCILRGGSEPVPGETAHAPGETRLERARARRVPKDCHYTL